VGPSHDLAAPDAVAAVDKGNVTALSAVDDVADAAGGPDYVPPEPAEVMVGSVAALQEVPPAPTAQDVAPVTAAQAVSSCEAE
jgi:hypothetical protein